MRPYFADREWARLPAETRRKVLTVETKRIVNDIRAATAGTGLDHPKAHVSWSPLELDREGYDEVAELLGGVLEKLHDIQARSSARQGDTSRKKATSLSTEVAIVHFERPRRTRRPRAPK
jgi:hypothetical protein